LWHNVSAGLRVAQSLPSICCYLFLWFQILTGLFALLRSVTAINREGLSGNERCDADGCLDVTS
jgi:hypothetical protein